LKVLIASAILVMTIGVLLQLFGSGMRAERKAGERAQLLSAKRTILAQLETVNPALQSEGKGQVMALDYSWKAKQVEPFQTIRATRSVAPRQLGLFALDVRLIKPSGGEHQFRVDRLGWRATR